MTEKKKLDAWVFQTKFVGIIWNDSLNSSECLTILEHTKCSVNICYFKECNLFIHWVSEHWEMTQKKFTLNIWTVAKQHLCLIIGHVNFLTDTHDK
jgi:hypothetical protein